MIFITEEQFEKADVTALRTDTIAIVPKSVLSKPVVVSVELADDIARILFGISLGMNVEPEYAREVRKKLTASRWG